jgi:hypothetical protein
MFLKHTVYNTQYSEFISGNQCDPHLRDSNFEWKLQTAYPDWGFLWSSYVPPGKQQNSNSYRLWLLCPKFLPIQYSRNILSYVIWCCRTSAVDTISLTSHKIMYVQQSPKSCLSWISACGDKHTFWKDRWAHYAFCKVTETLALGIILKSLSSKQLSHKIFHYCKKFFSSSQRHWSEGYVFMSHIMMDMKGDHTVEFWEIEIPHGEITVCSPAKWLSKVVK